MEMQEGDGIPHQLASRRHKGVPMRPLGARDDIAGQIATPYFLLDVCDEASSTPQTRGYSGD